MGHFAADLSLFHSYISVTTPTGSFLQPPPCSIAALLEESPRCAATVPETGSKPKQNISDIAQHEELPKKPGSVHKEFLIQLSKSHYPAPAMEFADIDDNYCDLCGDKTKISPT